MAVEHPLSGVIVAELGGREAVGVCGTLLAQLGATVIVVEPNGPARPRDALRAQSLAGKLSLSFDSTSEADKALLASLIAGSDVVIASSDIDAADLQVATKQPANIVCNLTAFGAIGPRAGEALSELQLQALTGLMDTTGMANGPPLAIGVPVVSYFAAAYGAAAVLAALRVKRRQRFGQRIEVAMFDAAFASLHVFLAGVKSGQAAKIGRIGNRHSSTPAWNLFATADGSVLICAGSQAQWTRLCELMQRPDVAAKFDTAAKRMQNVDEVEAEMEAWTRTLSTAACVESLIAAGVAAGPIAPIDQYPREANLDYRGMIRTLFDPVSGRDVFVPASAMPMRGSPPVQPASIPARDADRARVEQIASQFPPAKDPGPPPAHLDRPLAGIRIVEVGQYTSAPLCARHLAHLGAEVIKVEKRGGDESRTFGPRHGERSEVYGLNNADKRSIVLDLQSQEGMDVLKTLLRTADVLVENTKPGTLAKFGLSAETIAEINPNLVYCAISGFGSDSMYGDRPGFDTVIQAMAGFMTAVNPGGIPFKSGISSADLMGTLLAITGILAALEFRARGGAGQFIDLSMQDAACWLTAAVWNKDLKTIQRPAMVQCADGFVFSGVGEAELAACLGKADSTLAELAMQSRAQVDARLRGLGLPSAPVNSVIEACDLPQTEARGIFFTQPAEGRDWPMVGSPFGLQLTPPQILRAGPSPNEDGPAILKELGLA